MNPHSPHLRLLGGVTRHPSPVLDIAGAGAKDAPTAPLSFPGLALRTSAAVASPSVALAPPVSCAAEEYSVLRPVDGPLCGHPVAIGAGMVCIRPEHTGRGHVYVASDGSFALDRHDLHDSEED
jgi:hypothetical protein